MSSGGCLVDQGGSASGVPLRGGRCRAGGDDNVVDVVVDQVGGQPSLGDFYHVAGRLRTDLGLGVLRVPGGVRGEDDVLAVRQWVVGPDGFVCENAEGGRKSGGQGKRRDL